MSKTRVGELKTKLWFKEVAGFLLGPHSYFPVQSTERPVHTQPGGHLKRKHTVELHWLEHLWNNENMFETGAGRANEC